MAQGTQTFGKYQILERVATGRTAEVYKARLDGLGGFERIVAIKRVLPHLSHNAEYVRSLVDEAKVAGLLSHANIVQILDLGQADGLWYIAMEYVHGRDLGTILQRAQRKGLQLPVPQATFITIELLKALEYAHSRQVIRDGVSVPLRVVHRDISPPNVLISFQGEAKLTDFGIAKAALNAAETMAGHIKGRFDYMSAEQAGGARDLDQRSDLFSVGTLLYEMLTCTHPFRADSELATIERVRTGQRIRLTVANPDIPLALEAILDRALAVDRNQRYPNASAFREALESFFHEMGFLATVATLAAYVRNLFPEADPRPTSYRPDDGDILDDADDVDLGMADSGTSRLDRALASFPSLPARLSTPHPAGRPLTGTNAPVPQHRDFEAEAATVVRKMWTSAEQQETALRRVSADILGGNVSLTPQALTEPDIAPIIVRRPAHESRPRRERVRAGNPAPMVQQSVGWLGGLLVAVAALTGIFVGAVTVLLIVWAADLRAEIPLDAPAIRVTAPAGTTVLLDGAQVGTEFDIKPNRSQTIEVRAPGQPPWRRELQLPPGAVVEVLVLTASH